MYHKMSALLVRCLCTCILFSYQKLHARRESVGTAHLLVPKMARSRFPCAMARHQLTLDSQLSSSVSHQHIISFKYAIHTAFLINITGLWPVQTRVFVSGNTQGLSCIPQFLINALKQLLNISFMYQKCIVTNFSVFSLILSSMDKEACGRLDFSRS